jgi:HAD superfamily hydrolase (TIGR01484 family)
MIKPYQILATDYDGTLAHHGVVSPETLAAVKRLRASGKRLVLVTGRELEELSRFSDIGLCDLVVAETARCFTGRQRPNETSEQPTPPHS